MAEKEATEDVQQLVQRFQIMQQQLQNVMLQKESLKLQDLEIDSALRELEATKQANAYRITGSVMVCKPVAEIKDELKEAKETIGLRTASLDKTEKRVNDTLLELQEKLKKFVR